MKVIFYEIPSSFHKLFQIGMTTGAFCQFSFWWNYDYGSNKSTGLETAKLHLCALIAKFLVKSFLDLQNE